MSEAGFAVLRGTSMFSFIMGFFPIINQALVYISGLEYNRFDRGIGVERGFQLQIRDFLYIFGHLCN